MGDVERKKIIGGGYFPEINIAKGITVLLVLLGHSFPDLGTGIANPVARWIFQAIYSFHMGAFFFYSGFVSSRRLFSRNINLSREIKKKLWHVGYPYLLYSLISLLLKVFMSAFAAEEYNLKDVWQIIIGVSPNGTMWFLWVLLVISILYLFVACLLKNTNRQKKEVIFFGIGFVFLVLYYLIPNEHIVMEVFRFAIYYAFGIVAAQYYEVIKTKIITNKLAIILCAVVFLLGNIIDGVPYYITCPVAIVLLMAVAYMVSQKEGATNRILNEFGDYSYDLYLISYFVQRPVRVVVYRILGLPYVVVILTMFVCGTVITYLVCKYVIRKVEWLNRIFLGKVWF